MDVFGPGLLYPPTLGADGALYGTAYTGEVPGDTGAVYRLTPGGQYAVLHAFTGGADGKHPVTGLVQGLGGWFYGTALGGAHGQGVVFRVHP